MNEIEFRTAREAVQVARDIGAVAIMVGTRRLVTGQPEADRLAAAGVSFAYLCRFGVGDLIMTIPVN